MFIHQSRIHGKGVFAPWKFSQGEEIAYFEGFEIDNDTHFSLSLGGRRIEPTGQLMFLNHSCNPKAHFIDRRLFASRDIPEEEEITIDYLTTENIISNHFTCKCNAENCRGSI